MEEKVNRMDALRERVANNDTNLSAHSSTLASINSTMDSRSAAVDTRLAAVDSRSAAVDSRIAALESRISRQSSGASTHRLTATTSHSCDSIPQSSPSPRSASSATPPMMSSGASSAQTPVRLRVPRQGSASDQTTLPRNTLSPSPLTASSAAAAVVAASAPRQVGLLLKGLLLQVPVYATVY